MVKCGLHLDFFCDQTPFFLNVFMPPNCLDNNMEHNNCSTTFKLHLLTRLQYKLPLCVYKQVTWKQKQTRIRTAQTLWIKYSRSMHSPALSPSPCPSNIEGTETSGTLDPQVFSRIKPWTNKHQIVQSQKSGPGEGTWVKCNGGGRGGACPRGDMHRGGGGGGGCSQNYSYL